MRLDQFDLNLLIVFEALIEERSVTRAAQRLNVTQSAMSASLKRLRHALSDEVLVQHGKRMTPTAHALDLAPRISDAIANLRNILTSGVGFDPAVSNRRFIVAVSDYFSTIAWAPLAIDLEKEAPHVRIDIGRPDGTTTSALNAGHLDLFIAPEHYMSSSHPRELLVEEDFVVVGCIDNPMLHSGVSIEEFYDSGHVIVSIGGGDTFIDRTMSYAKDKRRIEVQCASFVEAVWFLPGTRRITVMHRRLAEKLAAYLPIALSPLPFPVEPMRQMAQFHSSRSTDAGLRWLLQKLRQHISKRSGAAFT